MLQIQSREPLFVRLKLMTRELNFEIDTGSGLSIIFEKTYSDYFVDVNLQSTKVILRTYSNEPLSVLGKINPIVEWK